MANGGLDEGPSLSNSWANYRVTIYSGTARPIFRDIELDDGSLELHMNRSGPSTVSVRFGAKASHRKFLSS